MADEIQLNESSRKWLAELKLAERDADKWVKRGRKIIKRYRDERTGWSDTNKRYNILWANVQTTFPALYAKPPQSQVERRFKDQDPVARTAAVILERALQYEIDSRGDFDASMRLAIMDRLLPGRGVCWVRFETKELAVPEGVEAWPEATGEQPEMMYECTPVDYVFWEDFRHSPARTWDEVTWVARRVYMTRQDGVSRFGDKFEQVPLTHEPIGLDDIIKSNGGEDLGDDLKKAKVWEIWNKTDKTVVWVAEGYDQELDKKDDPYGLEGFWPCPRPLFSTLTSDSLSPVPDFSMYQDQADELDKLTNRIGKLTDALKVVGVYDASQPSIQRMLNEGTDNSLIAVDSWAAFGEKGGLKGTVDFMPLDMVIQTLMQCYQAREQVKAVIYEITGLSDIIRGSSQASETATAQQIKAQYGSLRIRALQYDIARFASDLLRIKGQLMCDLYAPETLAMMSGIQGTQDAQYLMPAIQLLKTEPSRNYRIEVAADSLVEMDEQSDKQSRMEFLQATGAFLQQALPVAQQVPEMTPLLAEMLLFGVRAFKGGRPMEAAFDAAMAQLSAPKPQAPLQPDPEQIKAQAQMQIEQAKAKLEQAKMQNDRAIEAAKMDHEREIEAMKQQAETERARMKAQIDAETRLQIAAMNEGIKLQEMQAVS